MIFCFGQSNGRRCHYQFFLLLMLWATGLQMTRCIHIHVIERLHAHTVGFCKAVVEGNELGQVVKLSGILLLSCIIFARDYAGTQPSLRSNCNAVFDNVGTLIDLNKAHIRATCSHRGTNKTRSEIQATDLTIHHRQCW